VTGILFLAADAAGFLTFFAKPALGAVDLLPAVAAGEATVLAAALLALVMGWADAGIGIAMYPVLRKHNEGVALGAAAFRVLDGAFVGVGAVLLLLLVSVSRQAVGAGPLAPAQLQVLGRLVLDGHTWAASVVGLMAWCIGAALYYALFWRARLVPRWLSAWGLAGLVPLLAAIVLVLFRRLEVGSSVHTLLVMPVGLQEIVLGAWLIARGFTPSTASAPCARAA
jgi:hypothetical protein